MDIGRIVCMRWGMKKNGRPRKEVDFEKIDALCKYHCTAQEIVAHLQIFDFDVSYDTVERRVKEKSGLTFAEYINQNHLAYAKPSLRKLQWKAAEGGNTSMLIWLGKQYLGQSDKQEIESEHKGSIVINSMMPEPSALPPELERDAK